MVPLLLADLFEVHVGHLISGIVDQDVDFAKFLERPIDQLAAMRRVLDVAGDEDRAAPGLFDPARRLPRVFVLAEVRNQNVGALASKGDRDSPPDPGIGPGDQRGAALQLTAASVGMLAVIGPWIELVGKTGRVLLLAGLRRSMTGGLRICRHRIVPKQKSVRPKRTPRFWVPLGQRKA